MAEFSTSCRVSSQSHSGPLAGSLYNLIQDLFQELFIITWTFAGFIFNYPGPHAEPLCNPIKLLLQGTFKTWYRTSIISSRASTTFPRASCRTHLMNSSRASLQPHPEPLAGPLYVSFLLTSLEANCLALGPLKKQTALEKLHINHQLTCLFMIVLHTTLSILNPVMCFNLCLGVTRRKSWVLIMLQT